MSPVSEIPELTCGQASPKSDPRAPLVSWQALFMNYGLISVLWGIFVFFWLPDSPMRAKCFSETDKALMIERVRSNQTGRRNKTFRWDQVKEALTDPQM
jgi:hypothetical protein